MPIFNLFILCLLTILLAACAPFGFNDQRAGVCNQLNSEMIFSGGTSNTRNADMQLAEQPLLRRSYDESNCYVPPKKTIQG